MASPISWVGGKQRLAGEILKRIPKHTTYVEVFCGAAHVLFAKDPGSSNIEIINDIDGELTNLFRCMRERPFELVAKLNFRLISQEDFKRDVTDLAAGVTADGMDEITRAGLFFWVLKNAFGSRMVRPSFGYSLKKRRGGRSRVSRNVMRMAWKRLADVFIFCEDFETLIMRLDRMETFFYCDPPYYGAETLYPASFGPGDHERLAKLLRRIKGRFLLSYNDHGAIRKLYSWAHIEEIATRYSIGLKSNARGINRRELLIRNYELSA